MIKKEGENNQASIKMILQDLARDQNFWDPNNKCNFSIYLFSLFYSIAPTHILVPSETKEMLKLHLLFRSQKEFFARHNLTSKNEYTLLNMSFSRVLHAFFIRNDKMASSTRSFLIFTPFLVPKIS